MLKHVIRMKIQMIRRIIDERSPNTARIPLIGKHRTIGAGEEGR
jgi:hypothetical protein